MLQLCCTFSYAGKLDGTEQPAGSRLLQLSLCKDWLGSV